MTFLKDDPRYVWLNEIAGTWQENPETLIISGYTVIRQRPALETELSHLWQEIECDKGPK